MADTPAAISVFTPQFIADIGATDVNDLVQYSVNTDNDLLMGGAQNLQNGGNDPIISIRGIAAGSGAAASAGGQGGLYTTQKTKALATLGETASLGYRPLARVTASVASFYKNLPLYS